MASKDSGTGLWLIAAVAGLLGLRGLSGEPKPLASAAVKVAEPAPKTSASAAGTSPADKCDDRLAEAACDARVKAKQCDDRLSGVLDDFKNLYGRAPRPIIALVPDPLDSGLAYYFDAVLEGIEAAVGDGFVKGAGTTSWVRDRFFLPWRELDADKPSELSDCRATHPGVVLFREQADPQQSLAVLLVGESQTWGVPRVAMTRAIELARSLTPVRVEGVDGQPPFIRLDVLGPTFSGSAPSLSAVLNASASAGDTTTPGLHFRVRSGTASGTNVVTTLTTERVSYASSAASDTELSDTLYCRLRDRLRVPVDPPVGAPVGTSHGPSVLRGVALFSEGGTAYGSHFAAAQAHSSCPVPQFNYSFPNVLEVRAAWGNSPTAESGLSGPRYTLGLGEARDPLPRIHPVLSALTPIARDVSLASALDDLSGKAVSYVGIVATDANDVVFLASRIRKQLPDARLFAFGSDILLQHPDQAAALGGMLVVHGVLPIPALDGRVGPSRDGSPAQWLTPRLDVSTREMVRGVYLATQALVPLAEYPVKLASQLSVVGRGKLWGVDPSFDRTENLIGVSLADPVPKTFALFSALAALFGLLNAASYFAQTYAARARAYWSPLPLRALRACRVQALCLGHATRVVQLLSCVSFPLLLIAFLLLRRAQGQVFDTYYYTVLGVSGVVVAAFIDALLRMLAAALKPGVLASDRLNALVTFGVSTFLAISSCRWADSAPLARTVALTSGVSPLIPVLLGASILYVTALVGLIRVRLLDAHAAVGDGSKGPLSIARALGETREGAAPGNDIGELEARLGRSLEHPWGSSLLQLALASTALGLAVILAFVAKPPLTLERTPWHDLLVGILFGCMLAQASTYARLFLYFVELRMLLRRLAVHPIATALRHLTPTLARTVEAQLLTSRPEALDLAESVRLLGAVVADLPTASRVVGELGTLPTATELGELHAQASRALASELANVAERRVPGAPAFELRESLVFSAEKLAVALTPLWARSARLAGSEGAEQRASVSSVSALGDAEKPLVRLLENAEGLIATLVALCVERYARHFRYFAAALVITAVLFVPLTSLYAFEPQHLLMTLGLVATTVVVGTVLGMYFALDKDPVLSAIASTTPGEVTWNGALVTRVIAWGVLPMASVIAAQYPELTQWALSALGPATGAFK